MDRPPGGRMAMRPVETVKPYGGRLSSCDSRHLSSLCGGFRLSRHGSILYLPAIIYIIRSVYAGQDDEGRSPMRSEQVESIRSC
jgi:hypothetical protein